MTDASLIALFVRPLNLLRIPYCQMGKSDRHLRDIRQMLDVSGDLVDHAEVERWAARLGVEDEWAKAKGFQYGGA